LRRQPAERWQSALTEQGNQDNNQGDGICVSMDGRGRAQDNLFVERLSHSVKDQRVCLHQYVTLPWQRKAWSIISQSTTTSVCIQVHRIRPVRRFISVVFTAHSWHNGFTVFGRSVVLTNGSSLVYMVERGVSGNR